MRARQYYIAMMLVDGLGASASVWTGIREWISPIGTTSAVILALYLQLWRVHWNRPKLTAEYEAGDPAFWT